MKQISDRSLDRITARRVDKFSERREQLATAALQTLSELGYARTSLREIAHHSEFSHGVLHYYFADKVDLITHCVRQYKAVCVTRYDQIVATADAADDLKAGFAAGLATTMRADAAMHRLWYDLRAQSLFEASFRADVSEIDKSLERMIWRILSRYAELAGRLPAVSAELAYGVFDGLFQQALLKHLSGDVAAGDELERQVRLLIDRLLVAP
jgi:AcrR family transcriptional regulator